MPTITYSTEALQALIEGFQDRTLPAKKWSHEAHLIVALWYLQKYPKAEATHYLRTGIISYHSSQGGKHTLDSGYHETLTQFWIWAVHRFLQETKVQDESFAELVARYLDSEWADKNLPLKYYSKEYLMSLECRAYWRSPDLNLDLDLDLN